MGWHTLSPECQPVGIAINGHKLLIPIQPTPLKPDSPYRVVVMEYSNAPYPTRFEPADSLAFLDLLRPA